MMIRYRINKRTTFFAVSIWLFSAIAFSSFTSAASNIPSQGITVSPAIVTISVLPNSSGQSSTVGVKNNYKIPVTVTAELKDVDQENGILTPKKDLDSDLKSAVSLSASQFTIAPDQTVDVQVVVKNSPALKPGGTYLALVIRQSSTSSNSVGLQSAISAGIFITKEEGAVRQLAVTSFEIQQFLINKPSKAIVTFKNSGNVLLVPRGTVLVTDTNMNMLYQKGIVNQESITVYPNQSVALTVPLKTIKNSYIPQKQKVILQYRYDGTDTITTLTKTIWYVPLYVQLVILAALVVCVYAGLRAKKLLGKRNKKYSVKKAPTLAPKPAKKQISVQDENDSQKIMVRKG